MPASLPHDNLEWTTYGFAFGERLRKVRKTVGLTQEQLGHRAGIDRNQIQNLENNRNNNGGPANPSMRTLYQLAQAIGVPVIALLPSIGLVPPQRAVETVVDTSVTTRGLEIDLAPWLHAAREAISAERMR